MRRLPLGIGWGPGPLAGRSSALANDADAGARWRNRTAVVVDASAMRTAARVQ